MLRCLDLCAFSVSLFSFYTSGFKFDALFNANPDHLDNIADSTGMIRFCFLGVFNFLNSLMPTLAWRTSLNEWCVQFLNLLEKHNDYSLIREVSHSNFWAISYLLNQFLYASAYLEMTSFFKVEWKLVYSITHVRTSQCRNLGSWSF